MKLTVLCDNYTLIDRYFLGEPALSFLIETEGKSFLFDTGYSDVFIKNAEKMGIDLNSIDGIFLSHGHNDHTGGLKYLDFLKRKTDVYGHPDIDRLITYEGLDISMPRKLPNNLNLIKVKEPFAVNERLVYLGQIERTLQKVYPLEDDYLWDDTALAYKGENGLFIISGCSHSGIINICEFAKKVTGVDKIDSVIGGFHILNNDRVAREVGRYFHNEGITRIYPCHCTDLKARIILDRYVEVKEIGVSSVLEVS